MLGDPEDLKSLLSLPAGTVTDEELLRLLLASGAAIRSYIGYDPERQTYTRYHSGGGGRELVLDVPNVTALSGTDDADVPAELGIWLDATGAFGDGPGAFAAATKLVLGTDYAGDAPGGVSRSGILRWLGRGTAWGSWGGGYGCGGGWPPGVGNIMARFVAGYDADSIPADLAAEAVAEAAARWAAGVTLASGGGSGAASGGGSVSAVQLGQFRVSQGTTSSSSSRTAAGAGKATLYGANRGVLDRYRMPVIAGGGCGL